MDDDDRPIGQVLSRRQVLALLGSTAASVLLGLPLGRGARAFASTLAQDCIVRPEQTEGPFFVDDMLERSDIRTDPHDGAVSLGTPLQLDFLVSQLTRDGCRPLPGAQVDVWHCDAHGVYSGVDDGDVDTRERLFLRGHQITDGAGLARFQTIHPGFYGGRAVHVHFKVRTAPRANRRHEFTSQVYFDERVNEAVLAKPPYAARGRTRTRNAQDGLFRDGGAQLLVTPRRAGSGYAASLALALRL